MQLTAYAAEVVHKQIWAQQDLCSLQADFGNLQGRQRLASAEPSMHALCLRLRGWRYRRGPGSSPPVFLCSERVVGKVVPHSRLVCWSCAGQSALPLATRLVGPRPSAITIGLLLSCIELQIRWQRELVRRARILSRFETLVLKVITLLRTPVHYRLPLHQFGSAWNDVDSLHRCLSLEKLLEQVAWRITPAHVPQMLSFANVWANLAYTLSGQPPRALPLVTRKAFAALASSRCRGLLLLEARSLCDRGEGIQVVTQEAARAWTHGDFLPWRGLAYSDDAPWC